MLQESPITAMLMTTLTRRKCLELSGSSSLLPHFNSTTHTVVTATCPIIWIIPKIDSVYILFTFILRLHITKNSHDLIQVQRSQYYMEHFRGVMSTSLFSCEWRRGDCSEPAGCASSTLTWEGAISPNRAQTQRLSKRSDAPVREIMLGVSLYHHCQNVQTMCLICNAFKCCTINCNFNGHYHYLGNVTMSSENNKSLLKDLSCIKHYNSEVTSTNRFSCLILNAS